MKHLNTLRARGKHTYPKAFVQQYQHHFSDGRLDTFIFRKTAPTLFRWLEMIIESYPDLSKKQMDYALAMAKHILKYTHIPKEESAQLMGTFLYHYYPLLEAKFDNSNGRFGNHIADKFGRIRIRLIWIWFKCWVAHAKQTSRLFGSEQYDYWLDLKNQPFQKIIRYLPNFIWLDITQTTPAFSKTVVTHLGNGHNPKGVFPSFSSRMAHEFSNLTIEEYLDFLSQYNINRVAHTLSFYCYIKSIKKGLPFFKLIASHVQIHHNVETTIEKWSIPLQKLIAWNIEQLRRNEQQTLLGYIAHGLRDIEDFSLKGRTLQSIRRVSDAYYEALQQAALQQAQQTSAERAKLFATQVWTGATYQEWNFLEKGNWYAIFQLTSRQDLNTESAEMLHCVQSYAEYCIQGMGSIWSLRVKPPNEEWQPLVTIEVNNHHEIVQAKMKYNGLPSDDLLVKIKDWATQEKLIYLDS